MQMTLLKSITRLQKSELNEVAPCLWTISGIIGEQKRLANTIISVMNQLSHLRVDELTSDQQKKLVRLVRIAGEFGNACDFGDYLPDFKKAFGWFKGDSVPALLVEIICPFTSPKRAREIRVECLEAVCTISNAWPKQFMRSDVTNAFEIVFGEGDASLEEALLTGLEGFFRAQEVPEEGDEDAETEAVSGTDRLGKTYVATDQDGASTSMAQRFLPRILDIALASDDARSYAAARVVVSINKQGLVHPKESAPTLVALETCPNKAIAGEAFKEHKSQHQKHETMFEKEYIRAVQRTFEYQHKVIGKPAGFVGQPPTSKMHFLWEILKIGKAQARKKFLGLLIQKLDFDPATLKRAEAQQHHLLFVKFCTDNLAFFDYDKVDDILHLLNSLDRVFAGTGSAVAQAIESEVLKLRVEGLGESNGAANEIQVVLQQPIMSNGLYSADEIHVGPIPADTVQVGVIPMEVTQQPAPIDIEPARLQQLAISAQTLTLILETRSFLVRLWIMQKHLKSKKLDKDTNRTPNRATNAPSLTEAYLRRIKEASAPLGDYDAQRTTCSAFVELISVDNEVKIASDEEAEAELANGYDTPSESSSRKSPSVPGSGRGRKRKASSASNTPRKRGRPSLGKRKSTSGSKYAEESDDEGGWD
jgi:cohesin loading factor subunit SCC2